VITNGAPARARAVSASSSGNVVLRTERRSTRAR
jgi:hypothetical protein